MADDDAITNMKVARAIFHLLAVPFAILVLLTIAFMWGCPTYNVWEQGKVGEASLHRAEQDRQIAVQEAQAKMEAAKMLANAEIERARGVAEANRIIGEGLKGHSEYLTYLWIQELANAGHVIYVPTEANLPIVEAGRLGQTGK